MPTLASIPVDDLSLDLSNFRTRKQTSERRAIKALMDIGEGRFIALMRSILEDGFHSDNSILVLKSGAGYLVKEGNRRVACMKIILGKARGIEIPGNIKEVIEQLPKGWIEKNSAVPCVIYQANEEALVDQAVSRLHGLGEKAGRLKWNSIAKARHQRDYQGKPHPALDLLDSYLKHSDNCTSHHRNTWPGDYAITILEEALQKLGKFIGGKTSTELATGYPKLHKEILEQIVRDVGKKDLSFDVVRDEVRFGKRYELELPAKATDSECQKVSVSDRAKAIPHNEAPTFLPAVPSNEPSTSAHAMSSQAVQQTKRDNVNQVAASKPEAPSANTPKHVKKVLSQWKIHGDSEGRGKIVMLRNELMKLRITVTPHAFCLVLRSLFEISAKVYCEEHKADGAPSPIDKKRNGMDKKLALLLGEVAEHISTQSSNPQIQKDLAAAQKELGKADGILSVNSMNQLAHSAIFSLSAADIALVFGQVFPLLKAMNE